MKKVFYIQDRVDDTHDSDYAQAIIADYKNRVAEIQKSTKFDNQAKQRAIIGEATLALNRARELDATLYAKVKRATAKQ